MNKNNGMVFDYVFLTALNFFGPLEELPKKCKSLIDGGFFYGDMSSEEFNSAFRGVQIGSYLFQFRKG